MRNWTIRILVSVLLSFVLTLLPPFTVDVEAFEDPVLHEETPVEIEETEQETEEVPEEPDQVETVEVEAEDVNTGFQIRLPFQINTKNYPELELAEHKIAIFLRSDFNPLSYVTSMFDGGSDGLPNLTIDNNVNTDEEGIYAVKYTVTNAENLSTQKTLIVCVFEGEHQKEARLFNEELSTINVDDITFESEEVINDIRDKYIELSDDAKGELDNDAVKAKLAELYITYQEKVSIEEHRKALLRAQSEANARNLSVTYTTPSYQNVNNVYPGTNWNNCTWSVWQLVHDNMGISLPAWGNARNWYDNAERQGWPVGSEPRVNSIVVMNNHVCWVREVDGALIYVQEGNWSGMYHEGWMPAYGDRNGMEIYGYIYLD